MNYLYLTPFIISFVLFFSFLFFLIKRFPNDFPKKVLWSYKTFLFFIFEIFFLYLSIAFFLLSRSNSYIENGINCYKGYVRFKQITHNYDVCPVILNNFSQINFLYFSIVVFVLFVFIIYLLFKNNPKFFNVLFNNVDLFKEKKKTKISKGFIITVTIITLAVLIIGYMLFTGINSY